MSEVKIIEAHDIGNDVLEVHGKVDGRKVVARGWVSALERYPEKLAEEGKDSASKVRPMTKAERRAYCEQLLCDAAPTESERKPIAL